MGKSASIATQRKSLERLEADEYISSLTEKKGYSQKCEWYFNMGKLTLYPDEKSSVNVDFSAYRLKIIYKPNKKGNQMVRVFMVEPKPRRKKHFWPDGSLCLWKPSNFIWEKEMLFGKELFPTICTWLYHYTVWLETGKWHGEEAEH